MATRVTRPTSTRWSLGVGAALVLAAVLGACGDDTGGDAPSVLGDEAGGDARNEASSLDAAVSRDAGPLRAAFGLDARPANPTCKAPARPPVTSPVTLVPVYTNVTNLYFIVAMVQPPGDGSRWFAALLDGRVISFPSVAPPDNPTVVADIGALSGMTLEEIGEGGLLDLAFHPKFAQNGQLFVSWTTTGGPADMRSVVSRITSTDHGATFGQHTIILGPFEQPATSHKGGGTVFGPDGFLYLSFGDGGCCGDTFMHGQTTDTFFSKILRIDVDNPPPGKTYGIPDGNPFKNGGGEPATYARGFRNPWRFSFDRATGDLWVGDVGELTREEIDIVKPGGNYGWSCREGTLPYEPTRCAATDALVEPVYDYDHNGNNASITGGIVYRGKAIPELVGTYVFGDEQTSVVSTLRFDATTGAPVVAPVSGPAGGWVSFAEDQDGEIYALDILGHLYQLVRSQPAAPSTFPDRLSATGCVDPARPERPAAGVIPYDVSSPFWSDGADKERVFAIPDGKTIDIGIDGDFDLPIGSVLLKTFSLGGKRIETRLFVRHDDGEWAGYSYEWNDAQTDATLLPAGKTKIVGAQSWSFPSRSQCVSCHTEAAGRTLGLEIGQLDRDIVYSASNRIANELDTLAHIGLFSAPLGKAQPSSAYPTPTAPGPLEARARSYLHANCSPCHRPGGPGRGGLDLRYATPLAATKACGAAPMLGDLGVAGAKVIAPGSPSTSVLSLRAHALGSARMPPLASSVVDVAGAAVIDQWVTSLKTCP